MPVAEWVRELTEAAIGGPPFAVGDVVEHPDGYLVYILAGQYWGAEGFSNFWSWVRLDASGQRSTGEIERGYGWRPGSGKEAA